ncbi:MAG: deoxyribodipyrimidine photolyase [Hyphomicrobium sp.]|nr:deoxyribodipyrimidine photolyase [Hyphomicrobium sp.]
MNEAISPTVAAARALIDAVQPGAYARTRNLLDGAVSGLSPYITHGFVTLADVLGGVTACHALDVQHKFVYELGWRAYYRHVWQHRGDGILRSLHDGPLPDEAYARELPTDIRQACTGVPAIDQAVRTLYATGVLHNHARMWLASYTVHVRKVHWRVGADWLYAHLLDGDLASNHLSWQWVAGTGSSKPYLFNADNVARHAPAVWHSPGSVIDTSYEALDRVAREPARQRRSKHSAQAGSAPLVEPPLLADPPGKLGYTARDAVSVIGRDVWLVHPWSLGTLPADLSSDTRVVGVCVADFHRDRPWSERRWQFVGHRMAEITVDRWHCDAAELGTALKGARRVRSLDEPHISPSLARLGECVATPALFPAVDRRCDSFSQWWARASRGLLQVVDLLSARDVTKS